MIIIWLILVAVAGMLLLAVIEGRGKGMTFAKMTAPGHRGRPVDKELVQQRWTTIMQMSETGGPGLKNSVIEADKLLDHVLKQRGYAGATMADRLRRAEKRFTKINNVWSAHKLRNSLAHEVGFDLVPSQVKSALHDYERGLKDLGAL
jgi:hypothetical protein